MKNPLKKLIAVSLALGTLACTNSTLAIKPHLSKDDYAIVELRRKELHDQMIEYIPTANEDHNKKPISKLINRFKDHAETENELEEEKLEQAYASYLGPVGCDHINACLRGDLFIDWYPYEDAQDVVSGEKLGPWGTSLCVNPDEALLIMRKALRLKKDTNNSELCEMVLYRGVCLPRVLNSVENNNPTNRQFLENALAKINAGTCAED